MIIDCIKIASELEKDLKQKINKLIIKNIKPKLTIIKANNDLASLKYINNKIKKGNDLNIEVELIELNENINESEFINIINSLNEDNSVNGIIVQLPLYKHLNETNILSHISPEKDIDGLSELAFGNLWLSQENKYAIPCTAKSVLDILEYENINLDSKHVVIINRSNIVGKPLINLLLQKNATVTICHSYTNNLIKHTKNADIIVTAVGKKDFITEDMINDNCIIIDVGINVIDNKVYGDVSEQAKSKAYKVTKVPNGVGKLTVINVYTNLIKLINNFYLKD